MRLSDKFGPKSQRKTPQANCRNGRSRRKLQGDLGPIEIETPRDCQSSFEPQILGKHQRRVEGFDEKILALHAKGMTTRDIQDIIKELYDVDVSPDLISRVTEDLDGKKELLGLWIAKIEGAKFWLSCLTDLRNRGLQDIFICCVDGLAGFAEAIRAASKRWTRPIQHWKQALNHFAILFPDRIPNDYQP